MRRRASLQMPFPVCAREKDWGGDREEKTREECTDLPGGFRIVTEPGVIAERPGGAV